MSQNAMISVACVLLVLKLFASGEIVTEDCGDIQHDVETGMIRLPDFSGIRNLDCSWTYSAPPGRKLLVKVDSVHLPPLNLRASQFQLYVDDVFYDIPRNCVKCLRQMVGGKVLKVIFTSVSISENETSTHAESIGSFQVRYKAFDPLRCAKPDQIENGYIVNKGRKLGQIVHYHCDPPYDVVGDSELQCKVMEDSPVPVWSSRTPKCTIQDCTGEPIIKKGSHGAIASPGYPSYIYQFTAPCVWEIIAQTSQQIKASVTYLKFPKRTDNSFTEGSFRLLLLDGETNSNVLNLTEQIVKNPVNFTTLTNKLSVQFVAESDSKSKEEAGFYMEYSLVSSACPLPIPLENGHVNGYSADLGSTITYSCKQGFVLVGEAEAECLFNRQWSHPTPSCEHISESVPPSFIASNDSEIVTHKLSFETAVLEEGTFKEIWNFSETDEISTRHLPTTSVPTSVIHPTKMLEKENGPKSQPHLLQANNAKGSPKQPPTDDPLNASVPKLPALDKGFSQEIDFGLFKLNLFVVYIIVGAGIPIFFAILILIVICIYRKRYPVRMRFGRKFSTFENPIYVQKDAQNPKELNRLTN